VKWLGLFAGSSVVAAVGTAMVRGGEPLGWLALAFGGVCAVFLIVLLLPGAAFLRLDQDGFTWCSLYRKKTYLWSDINVFGVWTEPQSRTELVGFDFADSYEGSLTMREVNKELTGFEASLPDSYGLTAFELAELMGRLRDEYADG